MAINVGYSTFACFDIPHTYRFKLPVLEFGILVLAHTYMSKTKYSIDKHFEQGLISSSHLFPKFCQLTFES
jgi:hypothetical protein